MVVLYLGDCLEKMKSVADKSVDLIICDLPYGCLHGDISRGCMKKGKSPYFDNGWDIKIDLVEFWKQIKRIRKNKDTPCIMFCSIKFGNDLINSNSKEFQYEYVWDKQRVSCHMTARIKPMKRTEYIYVFSNKRPFYNLIKIENDKFPHSLISIKHNAGCHKQHPTEKPIDLYKFLIQRYSNSGDTVLDPTFGSGNSGLACIELNRKYIGIEKDNNFFWKFVKKL